MTAKPSKQSPAEAQDRHRVLVVDDHPMTRYGMALLVAQESDLIVCAEASDAQRALVALKTQKAEVVLADLTLPGKDGLEFIKDVRTLHPEVAVLVVSMHDEELYAERALRAGARGYIMKNEGGEKLVEAIRQVLRGKIYLSAKMSEKAAEILSGRRTRAEDGALGKLTDREFEVFGLLGQGLTTREIARRLHLGVKTVETHRLHVRVKLQMKTGPALIQYAVRWAGSQQLI